MNMNIYEEVSAPLEQYDAHKPCEHLINLKESIMWLKGG